MIAVAVATSRALLGVHWLTDVIAGLAIGWGWFALVVLGVQDAGTHSVSAPGRTLNDSRVRAALHPTVELDSGARRSSRASTLRPCPIIDVRPTPPVGGAPC